MFLTLSAGGAFSVKMAERASGSTDRELPALDGDAAPWLPDRIKDVLTRASDFAAYKRTRVFRFLRLFAGKNDVLGKERGGESRSPDRDQGGGLERGQVGEPARG